MIELRLQPSCSNGFHDGQEAEREIGIFLGHHISRDHIMLVLSPRTSPHNGTPESKVLLAADSMSCYGAQMKALHEDEC